MIRYSPRSARAIGLLKSFYNDIEIFVEDKSSPNMHLLISRRILGDEVRLSSVNPLGGREAVVEACRLDQAVSPRKRLYLIDGDLDLIMGRAKPKLKYLYRLKAYCVENLLLGQSAVEAVCLQSAPQLQPLQVRTALDFPSWMADLAKGLVPLFKAYGMIRAIDPTLRTVGTAVHPLCVQHSGCLILDYRKVFAHIRRLFRQINPVGRRFRLRNFRPGVEARCSGDVSDLRYVSGRDYLLPLLYHRLRAEFGFKGTTEQLKVQLAAFYDPRWEPFYARALRAAVTN